MEKLIQPQTADQLPRQPRPTEFPAVLDAHLGNIDVDISRLRGLVLEQRWLIVGRRIRGRRLLHSQPAGFVQAAEIRHDALPRPSLGADRFDQRPIGMSLAIDRAIVGTKKHECVVRSEKMPSRPVFSTTSPFTLQHPSRRPPINDLRQIQAEKIPKFRKLVSS